MRRNRRACAKWFKRSSEVSVLLHCCVSGHLKRDQGQNLCAQNSQQYCQGIHRCVRERRCIGLRDVRGKRQRGRVRDTASQHTGQHGVIEFEYAAREQPDQEKGQNRHT